MQDEVLYNDDALGPEYLVGHDLAPLGLVLGSFQSRLDGGDDRKQEC